MAPALVEGRREVLADQFVQDLTEHVVPLRAHLVAECSLEVSDPFIELSEDAVTFGASTHHGGSAIVLVWFHRDESDFLKFADTLTDRLLGDPTLSEHGGARALRSDEAQDPSVRATKDESHLGQSLGQGLADSSLQRVGSRDHVRNRRRSLTLVNHVDSIVNHVYDPAMTQVRRAHSEEHLQSAIRAVGVDPGAVASWSMAPLTHRVENLTTASLDRVKGVMDDDSTWSIVAKTLQPASSSPMFAFIPPEHHAQVLDDLRWLNEPDVYRSALGAQLPSPLRMPAIHTIESHGPSCVTIWMEDVDDVTPWDLARYRRTAEALGALGGQSYGDDAEARFDLRPRDIASLFFGKIVHHDLPLQETDEFWDAPEIVAVVDADHRRDLFELAALVPVLLERLALVPRGVCHGDATPDNFREPAEGSIVALDWSYGHVGELGGDLGQLLVGRFESGAAHIDDLEPIARAVLAGYCAGLERSGADVDPALVETAWAVHLAIRSVFSALVLDHRPDLRGEERLDLLRVRARTARFGIDMARRVAQSSPVPHRS